MLVWLSSFRINLFSVQKVRLSLVETPIHSSRFSIKHESKSSRFLRRGVKLDVGVQNLAILAKVVLQSVTGSVPRQASYENFAFVVLTGDAVEGLVRRDGLS
jgi:hypothetical protein